MPLVTPFIYSAVIPITDNNDNNVMEYFINNHLIL